MLIKSYGLSYSIQLRNNLSAGRHHSFSFFLLVFFLLMIYSVICSCCISTINLVYNHVYRALSVIELYHMIIQLHKCRRINSNCHIQPLIVGALSFHLHGKKPTRIERLFFSLSLSFSLFFFFPFFFTHIIQNNIQDPLFHTQ